MNMHRGNGLSYLLLGVLLMMGAAGRPAAGQFSGGEGTAGNPWQLADAADLQFLAAQPAYYHDHFVLTADIDLTGLDGADYVIAADPVSGNETFEGTEFDGVFDGGGHVVRGLQLDARIDNTDFLGLFGATGSAAIIKTLGLAEAHIVGGDLSDNIGALAGANQGDISGCCAEGALVAGLNARRVGGLVGMSSYPLIECYAAVNVDAPATAQFVGGLVGYSLSYVSDCYARGSVTAATNAGGLVGGGLSWFILNSYFLRFIDGGGPDNGLGIALSDPQMRSQASFAGWDFFRETLNGTDETWKMRIYPVLSWQTPVGMDEFALLAAFWLNQNCLQGQLCGTVDWHADGMIDDRDLLRLTTCWLQPAVTRYYPGLSDDFETGDFSALPWLNTGWIIEDDPTHVLAGAYCAKATGAGDPVLQLTKDTTGLQALHFSYRTSTEAGFDELKFYIDGNLRLLGASGEINWVELNFTVSDGEHVFKWVYDKDASGDGGQDTVWIDKVYFTVEP